VEDLRRRSSINPIRWRPIRGPVQVRQLPLQGAICLLQDRYLPPQRRRKGRHLCRNVVNQQRQVASNKENGKSHVKNPILDDCSKLRIPSK
jgi:hypothetical protein